MLQANVKGTDGALAASSLPGVVDVSSPPEPRGVGRMVVSLAGAIAVALLVPVGVLVIGLPVALAVRAFVELILALFG